MSSKESTETATLAGGCFWCLEAIFASLRGVYGVQSGFAGGQMANPSYAEVCTQATGHAEVVQIVFDPQEISFRDLLEVFFSIHDPTTINRQGPDVGSQYRSAIFYHTEEQRLTSEAVIAELEAKKLFDLPVVTEVAPFTVFYPAEDYHKDYYRLNRHQPYCRTVIEPKIARFRKDFRERLRQ
ncbi:MAG: peptide-methionine (S)-S-oxide reductase MsrA [Firmicutes bacterium]|nr:peptide-methionine (S)-S-oxide reductase MsrA [Bacillota bacterium]